MTLVHCPECRTEVSDRASSCPSCGFPLAPMPQQAGAGLPRRPKPRSYLTRRFALGWAAAATILGFVVLVSGLDGEEGGIVFSAVALWGSSLTILWKARRSARAAAAPGAEDLDRLIQARLQQVEERVRREFAGGQDAERQLMELEERMEFMERLLTKVRDGQLGSGG